MRLTKPRLLALVGGLLGLAMAAFGLFASAPAAQASTTRNFLVTLYGWPDNSPPGNAIAYPKSDGNPTLHNVASGVGTYSNPITYATDKSELKVGTRVYYPYLHRYFIMEDDCVECDQDWTGHGPDGGPHLYHIDLWIGGKGGNAMDAIDCEDGLTMSTASGAPMNSDFILNPPNNLPVSSAPLFDTTTNACFDGVTPSTTTGYYKNVATGTCLNTVSGKVALAACSSTLASEEYTYNGAFLTQGNKCFAEVGTGFGMATCNGLAKQQWEINPNETFVNMNSNRCVVTSGTGTTAKLVLSKPNCTAAPAPDKWVFTETSSTPGVPLTPVAKAVTKN